MSVDAVSESYEPNPDPAKIEGLDVQSLVDHREAVPSDVRVGDVYKTFAEHRREYVAVLEGGKLLGLCSRGQIGYLLGSRYGFSLFSEKPIRNHLMSQHLRIRQGTPLLATLELALSRSGEFFYDDVALIDDEDHFLGIISIQTLIRVQSRLLSHKVSVAESQKQALEERNKALFRSLNELHQSQGRYGTLFENSALGVALLTPGGLIEVMNQRFRALIEADHSSPDATLTDRIMATERGGFLRLLQNHETGNGHFGPQTTEIHLKLPTRGPRLFKCFTSWIRETGQVCICINDITEERALERRMAQKEKSALLDSLVGGIAHELNNKLMPVLGYSQLIMDSGSEPLEPERLKEFALTIFQCADESGKIIRQLLQLSKPPKEELVCCDLRSVVHDAMTLLKFKLRERQIQVDLTQPDSTVSLTADPAQLKQVVVNIMLNAIDAMEKADRRQLHVAVSATDLQASLEIRDSGHGIRPEHLNRIFDPFFTTKDPDRGTGLGLSVCFSIIKQHGGEIVVESAPGEGTLFRIQLPLGHPIESNCSLPSHERHTPLPASLRARVLVVDDEPYITALVQEMLRLKTGFSVEWVSNGMQAIERIRTNAFDLVISDIRMPEMNGVQLFEWIAQNHPCLASRFLFITGDSGGAEMSRRLESVQAPILRKPFTLESLLYQCNALIRN